MHKDYWNVMGCSEASILAQVRCEHPHYRISVRQDSSLPVGGRIYGQPVSFSDHTAQDRKTHV